MFGKKLEEIKASNYIFKEANYVITNPVNNDNLVTRGAVATPLAYAFKELGEWITGSTYPQPYMKLRTNYQAYRWALNTAWVAKVIASNSIHVNRAGWSAYKLQKWSRFINSSRQIVRVITTLEMAFPFITKLASDEKQEKWERILEIYDIVTSNCPGLSPSPDAYCLCVLQHTLNFQGSGFYQALWNRFPESSILKVITKNGLTLNLIGNLAVATGTWDHLTYKEWSEYHGYPYNEILYALMNNKQPIKSKQFYQSTLLRAQCEGNYTFGNPDNWGVKIPKEDTFKPFTVDNIFAVRRIFETPDSSSNASMRSGVDYMLLYNLYEMANTLYWGGENNNPRVNKPCPCRSDTVYNRVNLVNSTFDEENQLTNFHFGSRYITRQNGIYGLSVKPIQRDTVRPHYNYYKNYSLRSPAYLFHDLSVTGNLISTNSITVAQDYRLCNSILKLNNKSLLETMPNNDVNFPSLIEVMDNSELVMNSGSVIMIQNNTRLVVEIGGKLSYKSGARIILNGPNAVLHIKGRLELAPGVTFQVEGGPNGKGYVIWDRGEGSPHYGSAELIAGAGSKMLFKEADYNKLALEVRGFSGMYLPNTLESFVADSCRINLKEQAFIMSDARFTKMKDVVVYGHNEGSTNPDFNFKPSSRGIHILGRENAFTNVTIKDCYEAIKLFNVAGQNEPLRLKQVTLVNNQIGVTNHGGRIIWDDGEIKDENVSGVPSQLRTGISGIGTQGASMLKNVTLSIDDYTSLTGSDIRWRAPVNTRIANLWSHGPGRYYLTKCKSENSQYGSIMHQSFLFPACSEFMNNHTSAYLLQGARLNAQNSSWNRFSWNPPDNNRKFITGLHGVNVYLDQGKNYIKGYNNQNNELFFMADLHQTQTLAPADGISGFNSLALQARGNQWAIGGISNQLLTAPQPGNAACVGLTQFSKRFWLSGFYDINYSPQYSGGNWDTDKDAACASVGGPVSHWPIDSGVIIRVNQSGGDGQLVAQMADSLKQEFDRPLKNYPELIRRAKNFLVAPLPVSVGSAVFEVYSQVHAIYPEAFTDTMIPAVSRTAILNAMEQELNTMQDMLIMLADNNEPHMWTEYRFEVHRDKALIKRVFNQRPQALMHLNMVIPSFTRTYDVQSLQAWNCLIQKEQAWIDSLIPYWMVSLDTCIMNLDSLGNWDSTYSQEWNPDWHFRHRGDGGLGEGEGYAPAPEPPAAEKAGQVKFELNIRPNPTNGSVKLNMSQVPIVVEVINLQGQSVQTIRKTGHDMELNMGYLPDGVYIVRVLHDQGIKTARIVKRTE